MTIQSKEAEKDPNKSSEWALQGFRISLSLVIIMIIIILKNPLVQYSPIIAL